MTTSTFYEFPHSHFCEKARWALDHKNFNYQAKVLYPPWHIATTRRYGKRTYVPLLVTPDESIQGSSEIITWLDKTDSTNQLTHGSVEESVNLEKEIDKKLGAPIRVFLYHHTIPFSKFVCDAFTQKASKLESIMFRAQYPVFKRMLKATYNINAEHAKKSIDIVFKEMDRLWELKGSKKYFQGDQFGRIDITICALLAFVPRPPQHPFRWLELPNDSELRRIDQKASEHPLCKWVSDIYAEHR